MNFAILHISYLRLWRNFASACAGSCSLHKSYFFALKMLIYEPPCGKTNNVVSEQV